jgi:hypothetical protein
MLGWLEWMRPSQLEKPVTKGVRMNRIRGMLMLIAAVLAFWRGWQIHRGETAVLAYGLGAMALAVGAWHLTRKTTTPRPQPRPRV